MTITHLDEAAFAVAGGASRRGTGGMITKRQAAKTATAHGADTYILNDSDPAALYDLLDGVPSARIFAPHTPCLNFFKKGTDIFAASSYYIAADDT